MKRILEQINVIQAAGNRIADKNTIHQANQQCVFERLITAVDGKDINLDIGILFMKFIDDSGKANQRCTGKRTDF